MNASAEHAAPYSRHEVAFLSVLFLLLVGSRAFLAASLELMPDEALYALLAERAPLLWSSFPPGVLLLAQLGSSFGDSELALRWPSVLMTSAALFPFHAFARELGNPRAATFATLCFAFVPMFGFFGATLTPDGAQLFVWCVLLLLTWRALRSGATQTWLCVGIAAGVGLWVKYPLVVFWPSLLLAFAFNRAWRTRENSRGTMLALAVCALFLLPPLSQGGFGDALSYHGSQRQSWRAPDLPDFAFWHAMHAAYLSPLLYAACLWALWRLWREKIDARFAFCFSFSVATWLLFALVTAFTQRDLHREHWDALAYPPLLAALPLVLPRISRAFPVVAGVFTLLMTWDGVNRGPSRALNVGPVFWHLRGWREMARETDRRLATMPPDTLLVTESFVNAAMYRFYGAHPQRSFSLPSDYNARFGVASALSRVGFIIESRHDFSRSVLSVGGPYSKPEELAKWNATLRKFGPVRDLPPLQIRLDGKPFKTYDFRSFPK